VNREREIDPWINRLRSDGPERDAAIAELRGILVRGLSRSLTNRYGSPFHAEDVVQDALIRILDSLDSFEGRSRFTTWAMAIATRVGISALRRKHFQDVSLDAITPEDSMKIDLAVDPTETASHQIARQEIISKLNELIETSLTAKQKMAIRSVLEGLPVDEIARRSGTNRNAVYKLVHDARLKLKQGFEHSGIQPEDLIGSA